MKKYQSAEEPTPGSSADLLPEADPHSVARSILLRALNASAKSRKQLAELLAKRGIPDDVAEEVLDRYVEVGLINDAAFANTWVTSRHQSRGLAKRSLAQELREKGIAPDLAEAALEQITDEETRARELVAKKARAWSTLPYEKKIARVSGLLARKGYPSGIITKIAREFAAADAMESADLSR